jgi:SAM-dependent methyltransferase
LIKKYLNSLYRSSSQLNEKNILNLAAFAESNVILDLGCNDGVLSKKLSQATSAKKIYGIESNNEASILATNRGIQLANQDLEDSWVYNDNFFDLIHANQVIEHVANVDHFANEIFRVLKPGGKIIISTENGSSWHNIFASLMGWQIFSLTNVSIKASGIGNPMAIHRHGNAPESGWTHKTIFNYLGFKEFFYVHGFCEIKILGAGYYPLPSFFGKIDPRHSHFITLSAIKPSDQK